MPLPLILLSAGRARQGRYLKTALLLSPKKPMLGAGNGWLHKQTHAFDRATNADNKNAPAIKQSDRVLPRSKGEEDAEAAHQNQNQHRLSMPLR